jgi:hypothetical protein
MVIIMVFPVTEVYVARRQRRTVQDRQVVAVGDLIVTGVSKHQLDCVLVDGVERHTKPLDCSETM